MAIQGSWKMAWSSDPHATGCPGASVARLVLRVGREVEASGVLGRLVTEIGRQEGSLALAAGQVGYRCDGVTVTERLGETQGKKDYFAYISKRFSP